jgi:hypothetical protein
MGLKLSDAPEPPCVFQIIFFLSIAGTPDSRIAKEFGISTESITLNDLQAIPRENRCQYLDSPESVSS